MKVKVETLEYCREALPQDPSSEEYVDHTVKVEAFTSSERYYNFDPFRI